MTTRSARATTFYLTGPGFDSSCRHHFFLNWRRKSITNAAGILKSQADCLAGDAPNRSRMWLLVNEGDRLQQLIRQAEKLIDVISVEQQELKGSIFEQTETFFV